MPNPSNGAIVIYDGHCPFCSAYVSAVRVREAVGSLELVDAREPRSHGLLVEHTRANFDLDEGMVLILDDKIYHGADCVMMLALLSTRSGGFNRFNAWLFSSQSRSRLLYPFLKRTRNLTLRILGIGRLRYAERT